MDSQQGKYFELLVPRYFASQPLFNFTDKKMRDIREDEEMEEEQEEQKDQI
jgi:hypothetical protein